jgi:hypothetical protein
VKFVLHLVARYPIWISSHIYYSAVPFALLIYLHTGCGSACFSTGEEPDEYYGGEMENCLAVKLMAKIVRLANKNVDRESVRK